MQRKVHTRQLPLEDPVHASTSGLPGFAGNITEWKTYRNGSTASGATYAFTYDLLSRLTSSLRYAGNSNTATSPYTEQGIAYDRTGKIKSLARYGSAASQVENISTVNSAGNDLSTYDQYRNMTLDAHTGSAMQWNILNMVRKVTPSGGSAAKYTFLADGTKARVSSGSGTYLYLGSMVFSIPSSGSPAFESMAVAEGRIIATSSGNEVRYHITDHLGSVRTVLKADGTVVAENDYYPYGKRINTASATTPTQKDRHTFSGKEDQALTPGQTPYLDFGARMYSPETGSWLSVDPTAEKYYGIGMHVYCMGNAINKVDPYGYDIWEIDANNNLTNKEESSDDVFYYLNHGKRDDTKCLKFQGKHFSQDSEGILTKDSSSAVELFSFLSKNSDVEFGMIEASDSFHVFTDNKINEINMVSKAKTLEKKGDTIKSMFHSHPDNTIPSGFNEGNTRGDKFAAAAVVYSNHYLVEYYVYQPGNDRLIQYDATKIIPGMITFETLFVL